MSEVTSAPAGDSSPAPANDSVSELSNLFAQAREEPEEAPEEAASEPELAPKADVDPEKAPDKEPAEADPAEEPTIEPPRSWTKEEKEEFKSYPREAQERIAKAATRYESEFRRSQNEIAETRKAVEAEREQAKQERLQYEAKAKAYIQATNETGAFADIQNMRDLEKLQTEDPFRFQAYQLHVWKTQAAQSELVELEQKRTQERQSKRANYEAEQNKLLVELVPDMADSNKAGELRTRAVKALNDLGMTSDTLSRWYQDDTGHEILSNAGFQRLLADNLKYQDIKNAPKAIAAREPVPPVQRPGTSKPRGSANTETIQNLSDKHERTGEVADLAALLGGLRRA